MKNTFFRTPPPKYDDKHVKGASHVIIGAKKNGFGIFNFELLRRNVVQGCAVLQF